MDDLGDRMKILESLTENRLMPGLPILARIDGRAFHSFTVGLERPFCTQLVRLMQDTTQHLMEETHADVGYTQSDEISLCWRGNKEHWFGGRVQKIASVLSGMATAFFNFRCPFDLGEQYARRMPHFDCRVWQVPSLTEAANVFVWRELDAAKNSVSMVAQANFSHKELQGVSCNGMQELLHTIGINWNDYPQHLKCGSFFVRRHRWQPFSTEEIANLPRQHEARSNPDLTVYRSVIEPLGVPRLSKADNKVSLLFGD